eukprot:CAMPEP_0206462294 /NCGR_PEP_ID=MMETSP0324_2-20121206/25901_1 /ASSEMBLY_ACC=CAM_ASM_000836 /TAXON_ID=2866 /ORGANISM="Crypthecodinium cohnii, Strain Seligo" /LENGTH=227 /DNA_ID=CAMNT_0053934439 /DNA_START=47 /DNA_END=731 /DNA_ORIENTATION=+
MKSFVAAIFVLGGEPERDLYAVRLAESHPSEDVYVSSPGSTAPQRLRPIEEAGRLHLDWRAVDTVTNFSTMYDELLQASISKVLLVTSPYHMPRAEAVGSIMLGAANIEIETKPVPGGLEVPVESQLKIWRDCARAWVWRYTGMDFRLLSWLLQHFKWFSCRAAVLAISTAVGVVLCRLKSFPFLRVHLHRLRRQFPQEAGAGVQGSETRKQKNLRSFDQATLQVLG